MLFRSVEQSTTLEDLAVAIEQAQFVPVSAGDMVQHLRAIALPFPLAHRWYLGQKLSVDEVAPYALNIELSSPEPSSPESSSPESVTPEPIRVLAADSQKFLGIGEFRQGLPTRAADLNGNDDASTAEASTVFAPKRVYATL